MRAFKTITKDRPIGFGAAPIPWASIDRYAARHGIQDPDDFDEFEQLIEAMDAVYLEHHSKKKPPGAK